MDGVGDDRGAGSGGHVGHRPGGGSVRTRRCPCRLVDEARQRRPGRRATAYRTSPSAPVIGRPDLPMTAHLIMVKASRAGNRRR